MLHGVPVDNPTHGARSDSVNQFFRPTLLASDDDYARTHGPGVKFSRSTCLCFFATARVRVSNHGLLEQQEARHPPSALHWFLLAIAADVPRDGAGGFTMDVPRSRSLVLLAVLGVLMTAVTGCALLQPASDSAAPQVFGPLPLGVSVQQGRYEVRLDKVSVNGTRTISLSRRVSSDPGAMPDTATAAAQKPTDVKTYLVSAGSRPTARVGYRFVDAVVAFQASPGIGTAELQRGIITTATVLSGDIRHEVGDRCSGLAVGSSTVYETLEFELPMTAESALLRVGLKDTSETLSFRLW
jgi:hypothetical protein